MKLNGMPAVLYVDDEPELLTLCRLFLEKDGNHHVETAKSAAEGLTKLRAGHFDVIISDYLMPEADGVDFLRQVRAEFGNIPFILFTGRGREEVVIEAINLGVTFYLQKGSDPVSRFTEVRTPASGSSDLSRVLNQGIIHNMEDGCLSQLQVECFMPVVYYNMITRMIFRKFSGQNWGPSEISYLILLSFTNPVNEKYFYTPSFPLENQAENAEK